MENLHPKPAHRRLICCFVVLASGWLVRCGPPPAPQQKPPTELAPQNVNIAYLPDDPTPTPLHATAQGSVMTPRSILFATGTNADGRLELQVVVSDVAGYCDVVASGGAQDKEVLVRLRMIEIDPAGAPQPVGTGVFTEDKGPTWQGAVSDIPPPAARYVDGPQVSLAAGRHLTAGFVSVRESCNVESLNPAFVGSSVSLTSADAAQVAGRVDLWFADSAGVSRGFSLSGNFVATRCEALAAAIAKSPFVPYVAAPPCLPAP